MTQKIKILLIIAIGVIAAVVLYDSLSTRMDRRPANPFEYNVDEFKVVDESLVSYREARQIHIEEEPKALTYHDEKLFLLTTSRILVLSPAGRELLSKSIDPNPARITVSEDGEIVLGYENYLVTMDAQGNEKYRSEVFGEKSLFTSVAVLGEEIMVANGGEREVWVFNRELEKTGSFKGESGVSALHGFILPSLHFDMNVNDEGELWVTNPGLHRIQNYSAGGRLRGHWGEPSFGLEGFSGCCNPYFIDFLSDGRFVTSEKGIIRVKIHKESGELESVVAAPDKFPNGKTAPALAVDSQDNVWLLDFDKKMLRLFIPVTD